MAEAQTQQYAKSEAVAGPVFHESSRNYLEAAAKMRTLGAPAEKELEATDPLRSFELDRTAMTGDLREWNSFSEIDQARKVLEIVKRTTPRQQDMDAERKKILDSRRRQLCAVIWQVTNPAYKGSRKVAQAALDALLPEEKK